MEEPQARNFSPLIIRAILIAIVIGLVTTVTLAYLGQETYSTLYLVPGSFSNYLSGDTTSFTFGVTNAAGRDQVYTAEFYVADELVGTQTLSVAGGSTIEQPVDLTVPRTAKFPLKIGLTITSETASEHVHFWLKGRR